MICLASIDITETSELWNQPVNKCVNIDKIRVATCLPNIVGAGDNIPCKIKSKTSLPI